MSAFLDARALLAKAKDEYQRLLRHVDARLSAAVAQDPARIPDAQAVQAEYLTGFQVAPFAEHNQPAPAAPDVEVPVEDLLRDTVPATGFASADGE